MTLSHWGLAFGAMALAAFGVTMPGIAAGATAGAALKFEFGPGKADPGWTRVLPSTLYSPERGYGFADSPGVSGVERPGGRNFCTGTGSFFFSVSLPEGNYEVAVTLGDTAGGSVTTVKAEARRLMLEKVVTSGGRLVTHTFTVNVRHNILNSGQKVRLKADELHHMDWDDVLTLEFSNARPCLDALKIMPAPHAVTLYIAGDSTVCDQGKEPWCAWGQMLPRFFKAGIAVANYAESGESLRSFIGERRLEKIEEHIRSGDYLFIQFGHNDQKDHRPGAGAFTTYRDDLKLFIRMARSKGAFPVLVTPMNRRTFDATGKITNSLGDFPAAVRQTAQDENVPMIDLNAMSKVFYEAMGPTESTRAFVHYPAGTFPGQDKALKDNTHFNSYGAYELARCIVDGIRANHLGLVRFLADDVQPFDPAHPDPVDGWSLPPSPTVTVTKPEGN